MHHYRGFEMSAPLKLVIPVKGTTVNYKALAIALEDEESGSSFEDIYAMLKEGKEKEILKLIKEKLEHGKEL